ncbi:DUF4880 domain-containing protein [Sphingomonas sp. QA11]|uniref:FecR family protein n=1 Tax=Sphingomonas sp. QA11 TaxID=2950605 RepID=UPI00234ACD04|nr:DUF4880 domain-containing protein [Sphingomonas sp. QA11]WCM27848.1 DUF4880 domain-containing protein [Sphingomonas sp. QA11]
MTLSIERQERIEAEAADWLAALDAGRADLAVFEAWRASDPAHALAFIRMNAVWRDLDRLRAGHSAHEPADAAAPPIMAAPRMALPRRTAIKAAFGMAGALAAGGAVFIASQAAAHTVETAVGERRRFYVADHTCLDLNTGGRLRWWLAESQLEVELERGELALDLPQGTQPCTLHVGAARFRLGPGRFNVRLHAGEIVDLATIAGKAWILPLHGRSGTALVAERRKLVVTDGKQQARPLSDGEIQTLSAWQEGEILFDGQPLTEAIAEYNRYLPTPIELARADMGQVRLGGRFLTNDPSEFLKALRLNFGIRAEVRRDRIVLSS